jgi:hypothetical protein
MRTLESTKTVGLTIALLKQLASDTLGGCLQSIPVRLIDAKIHRAAGCDPECLNLGLQGVQFSFESSVLHGSKSFRAAGILEVYVHAGACQGRLRTKQDTLSSMVSFTSDVRAKAQKACFLVSSFFAVGLWEERSRAMETESGGEMKDQQLRVGQIKLSNASGCHRCNWQKPSMLVCGGHFVGRRCAAVVRVSCYGTGGRGGGVRSVVCIVNDAQGGRRSDRRPKSPQRRAVA